MTNQVAIKCHTMPGDEVVCDKLSHVYIYEGGGIAFNSGCQVRPIEVTAVGLMLNRLPMPLIPMTCKNQLPPCQSGKYC